MTLLLDGECVRHMPEFQAIPAKCVDGEEWRSLRTIHAILISALKRSEYAKLYPQLVEYVAGKKK